MSFEVKPEKLTASQQEQVAGLMPTLALLLKTWLP